MFRELSKPNDQRASIDRPLAQYACSKLFGTRSGTCSDSYRNHTIIAEKAKTPLSRGLLVPGVGLIPIAIGTTRPLLKAKTPHSRGLFVPGVGLEPTRSLLIKGFYLHTTAFAATCTPRCLWSGLYLHPIFSDVGVRHQVSTPSPQAELGSVLAFVSPQKRSPNLTDSTPAVSCRATLVFAESIKRTAVCR